MPWILIYCEVYKDEKLARMREKRLKQNGNALRELKKRFGLLDIQKKSGAGFTLLEVVVTLGIFTLGILGAMTLALANSNNAKQNLGRVRAANFAREGLELVRNIRDSNWLRIEANEDISPMPGLDLYLWSSVISNSNFFSIDYTNEVSVNRFACTNLESCISENPNETQLSLNSTTGLYDHGNSLEKLNMFRVIQMEHICIGANPADGLEVYIPIGASCSSAYIGLRATVRMEWEQNGAQSLEISQNFYNWRR